MVDTEAFPDEHIVNGKFVQKALEETLVGLRWSLGVGRRRRSGHCHLALLEKTVMTNELHFAMKITHF